MSIFTTTKFKDSGRKMNVIEYSNALTGGRDYNSSPEHRRICVNCGYPDGAHAANGKFCPTVEGNKENGYNLKPMRPRKRPIRTVLRIKFEVLLNEYDAWKAWKRNVMDKNVSFNNLDGSVGGSVGEWTTLRDFFAKVPLRYWVNSFSYSTANTNNNENYDWYMIAGEWSERLEKFRKNKSTN